MQQPKYKNQQQQQTVSTNEQKTTSIPFNHSLLENDVSVKFNKIVAEMESQGWCFNSAIPISATGKILVFSK